MGTQQSKLAMERKDEKRKKLGQTDEYVFSSPARGKYFTQHIPLHKATLKGDWKVAELLLKNDPTLVKARITQGGETALHIAAVQGHHSFVANLLRRMENSDTEILNDNQRTALCFAAAAGHVDIARMMVERNRRLPTIRGCDGVSPLYMAVLQGHSDMAEFLFSISGFESWTIKDQIALLTTCIDAGLYDLAMSIVDQHKMLAVTEDSNGETPLEVLARMPSAFCGSSQKRWWASIANTILHLAKFKKADKMRTQPCDAYRLFDCLWDNMTCQHDIETAQVKGNTSKLLFIAAESGNDEFVVELISRYPDFLYEVNASKHSIFHIAVSRRYVEVFNLIFELSGIKDLIATYIDKDGNNILHLAAKLAPQSQLNAIPGAALQMQREVLWYKEVEKIVQPLYKKMKNSAGETPFDVFLKEHEKLMKEGEKLMKQTAKSCMLVTMLIATVVFTTAFTVPGGYNNNTGAPILQNERLFMVFPISESVATLSSLTSMLMFLSILTSRYTEMNFLNSLPFWLVIGVAALFVSILAMMVVFCTCLLFFQHGLAAITVLLVFFASVPIMFIILKYPLLVTMLRCTYGCRWLFRSKNRLFT